MRCLLYYKILAYLNYNGRDISELKKYIITAVYLSERNKNFENELFLLFIIKIIYNA